MEKLSTFLVFYIVFFLTPFLVSAQETIQNAMWGFVAFLDFLVVIVVGLAVVLFFWGLVKFLSKAGDEEARAKGKQLMIWGIIAIFIMLSFWGIIIMLQNVFFPFDITDPFFDPGHAPS